MAIAGWDCLVEVTGTSTAFVGAENCSLVSGKTYEIDDATKSVLDPDVAVEVHDGGGQVAASNIESIDYLFGRVTFTGAYTPTGTVSFQNGNYLPRHTVDEAYSFRLGWSANMLNCNRFGLDYQLRAYGLRDTSMEIGVKNSPRTDYDDGGGTLELPDLIAAGTIFVVTLTIEDTSANEEIHRALGIMESYGGEASVEDQVMSTYTIVGTAKTQGTDGIDYSSIIT